MCVGHAGQPHAVREGLVRLERLQVRLPGARPVPSQLSAGTTAETATAQGLCFPPSERTLRQSVGLLLTLLTPVPLHSLRSCFRIALFSSPWVLYADAGSLTSAQVRERSMTLSQKVPSQQGHGRQANRDARAPSCPSRSRREPAGGSHPERECRVWALEGKVYSRLLVLIAFLVPTALEG